MIASAFAVESDNEDVPYVRDSGHIDMAYLLYRAESHYEQTTKREGPLMEE